tara:strand:- start:921 stop:1025 length:105 start_codon:yes stop_codon:yes gene_type:complete
MKTCLNFIKDVSEKYTVNRIIDELEKEYLELIDN